MAKKAKEEKQRNGYQGITIDLGGICDELTDRAKRFVFWYCFPGTDCFQHKKRAAIAAGYAVRTAAISGYKLCKNPQVRKEIERISAGHNTEAIDTLYRRYVNSLEARAFYDPADFVSGKAFKPIEEIAPEKRVCLDQPIIDTKEAKIVGYTFGSRRAALTEIKELHAKEHPSGENDEFDEEETIRIMNRVAETKVVIERRKRAAEVHLVEDGYITYPEPEKTIEEL
jgi:hypothetical protein